SALGRVAALDPIDHAQQLRWSDLTDGSPPDMRDYIVLKPASRVLYGADALARAPLLEPLAREALEGVGGIRSSPGLLLLHMIRRRLAMFNHRLVFAVDLASFGERHGGVGADHYALLFPADAILIAERHRPRSENLGVESAAISKLVAS